MGNASITAYNIDEARISDFLKAALATSSKLELPNQHPAHDAHVTRGIQQLVSKFDFGELSASISPAQNNAPHQAALPLIQNSGPGTSRA